LELCETFLTHNEIAPPKEIITAQDDTKKPPGKNPWHDKGWCWNGVIFVNLKKSRVPTKAPGFQWSYTGYKADVTAPGVLAHELGHYVRTQVHCDTATISHVRNSEPAVS